MDLTRSVAPDAIDLAVGGRLDGYWADHLDAAIAETVREGHHRIRLDLSKVMFISSAGIAVLMKSYKQLTRIGGSITVVSPSPPVRAVLDMTRLSAVLVAPATASPAPTVSSQGRRQERAGAVFELFDLGQGGLACRAVGRENPFGTGDFAEPDCVSLAATAPLFALGVGAFGEGFADCRARFGELVSITGATAYQPADGTNVPDYLVSSGAFAPDVRVLHALSFEGAFTTFVRFDTTPPNVAVGLAALFDSCLELTGTTSAGIVVIAEAAGLVGAALRRSPAQTSGEDFFAHPAIRHRLTFTSERAFLRSVAIIAGTIARPSPAPPTAQVRPFGPCGILAHVHAAAFSFRPLGRGRIDLHETVASLFEFEQLLGVLHLLHDDRGPAGAGESELIRGACWVGPLVDAGGN